MPVGKDALLKSRRETVSIKGIGDVVIRVISGRERHDIYSAGKDAPDLFTNLLISKSLVVEPLFTAEEVGNIDHDIYEAVAVECLRVNGMGKKAGEDAEKKS